MAILIAPTGLQKMEFNVTTAEGACRVTVVTGRILIQNSFFVLSSGPETQQTESYKVLVDPSLDAGKFRKSTATAVASWTAITNSVPGVGLCQISDAQATFDDEAGRVQLIIDVIIKASGA